MNGGRVRLPALRRAPRWRPVITVVLVLNVALGLAMSIIGLRHQADGQAAVESRLAWEVAQVHQTRVELWRAVSAGRSTPALDDAPVSAIAASDGAGADRFVDEVETARQRLGDGDADSARTYATAADTTASGLVADLRRRSTAQMDETRHASLTADVETVMLMLFAAVMGLVLVRRTVRVRLHAEQQRVRDQQRSEARFASLVQHSSDLISIVGMDSRIRFQTPSVQRVLGYDSSDLVCTDLLDLVHPDDRYHVVAAHELLLGGARSRTSTVRLRAADGSWRHVESVHTDMRDEDGVDGLVVTSRDVSERVALQDQIRHSALHDGLTGLANRSLFLDRVEHALEHPDGAIPASCVFLDVDDFKGVNDALGHVVGDALLVELARRLVAAVRDRDTVARLGGDEFAVLVEATGAQERDALLARLQHELRRPVQVEGRELGVTASLGVAIARPGTTSAALLANADLAMYAAKAAGKDALVHFSETMSVEAERRLRLKTDLARALREGQIRPWFQPTVSLATHAVSGFEALARWEHPERGLIPPLDFIPIAEQTGQIVEVGRTILREACTTLARWDAAHPGVRRIAMSVNLSARELAEPGLVEHVVAVLQETGIEAQRLTLEVTESLWVGDRGGAVDQLAQLRDAGVRVAIDDFGTGYSSLSYLEQLPVDVVKIDKSFVDRVTEAQPGPVIETITALTKALGLVTVAEGIEEHYQASVLQALGCDVGQGFLFSRPQPADEIDAWLGRHAGRPDRLALSPEPRPDDDAPRAA